MLKALRKDVVDIIASRHVAGPNIEDAIRVCRWASGQGLHSIIAPWAKPGDSFEGMYKQFEAALKFVGESKLDGYVSVKLEAIGNDFGLFTRLVDTARHYNVRIHLDSLGPESAPLNFDFLERASAFYKDLGCTLPARWKRSVQDAERAVELELSVRIVKGQWIDPEAPKLDFKSNYLAIASKLAGRARHVGVATHDTRLADRALKVLASSKTHFEFEQFFSLPLNGRQLAERYGCPYRMYVAYGYPGVPYNVRFSISRPSIIAWMLTDFAFKPKKPWSMPDSSDSQRLQGGS